MKHIHFIGIGGAGMAPLAELAIGAGMQISGSDLELNSKTEHLTAIGAKIVQGHRGDNIPPVCDLVVYTSAAGPENPELIEAAGRNIPAMRRGEFLAEFAKRYREVAAVSGTHGKSSITAMLVHILEKCGKDPGFLIGAERPDGEPGGLGKNFRLFVAEVDESDGTHTFIHPALGIIPNVESDHSWSVGGEEQLRKNFLTFANNCRKVIAADLPPLRNLFSGHPGITFVKLPEELEGFKGYFAKNGALSLRAAMALDVPEAEARAALRTYQGIARRMQIRRREPGLFVIEDYAHHPSEVEEALKLARTMAPENHLKVIIQPHRYARLERFFSDFCRVLGNADSVVVTPVFAAWSEHGSVNGGDLAKALPNGQYSDLPWEEMGEELLKSPRPVTLLILGAGDISRLTEFLSVVK